MRGTRTIAAVIVIAAIAAGLAYASARPTSVRLKETFGDAVLPILGAAGRAGGWFGQKLGSNFGHVRELQSERARLLGEIAKLENLRSENEILRQALELRREGEEGVLPATAVAFVREGRDEYLILDRGIAAGVSVGDLVLNRARVLGGTVVESSARASRVRLLTSPSVSTEITVAGRDVKALARGANSRELEVMLVPQQAELAVGDLIVASPRVTGGRRSMLIGEVRDVRQSSRDVFKTVRVIHLFDPADPDVLVLLAP